MTVELGSHRELVFDSGMRNFKDDRLAQWKALTPRVWQTKNAEVHP